MQAQRLMCTDKRKIEVESYDLPVVPDDGILVQNDITAVSVGTEIHNFRHGSEPGREVTFPRATGYCSTGIVLEVGKRVTNIQEGDRIAGQGNHASHAVLTSNYRKVPEGLPAKSAVYLVMCAVAMHGHRVGRPELGESVAITGLGIVGQLAASFAKLAGAYPVIAIDLNDLRLEKAQNRGIDICLNPGTLADLTETVQSHCCADGVDLLIEATGIPAVYPGALKLPRLGGRFVALGSPRGSVEVSFLPDIHLREITVFGAHQPKTPDSRNIYYPWTKERDRDFILQLMAQGKLPIEDLITHCAKPADCQDIYTMLADHPDEALGVVFEWK
jgi:2-desacetyl-2-hydroxyethyl bacteriochlorophyllide A dehydrogenase